jgi:hypothetical protein
MRNHFLKAIPNVHSGFWPFKRRPFDNLIRYAIKYCGAFDQLKPYLILYLENKHEWANLRNQDWDRKRYCRIKDGNLRLRIVRICRRGLP